MRPSTNIPARRLFRTQSCPVRLLYSLAQPDRRYTLAYFEFHISSAMAPHNQVHLNVLQRGANDADSASHVGSDVLSGLSLEDTEATSQGVIMMEGVARILTKLRRRGIFLSLFILSTAYGFDNVVRSAYQVLSCSTLLGFR